jgi:hypothetical protein
VIYRAFINQPSTLQPLHKLHGQRCIVDDKGDDDVTLYFTDGPIHSMTALRQCISRLHLSAAETQGASA